MWSKLGAFFKLFSHLVATTYYSFTKAHMQHFKVAQIDDIHIGAVLRVVFQMSTLTFGRYLFKCQCMSTVVGTVKIGRILVNIVFERPLSMIGLLIIGSS